MTQSSLATHIEANCERVVETTLDMLSFDTQNPPGATTELIDYIERAMTTAGYETERLSETTDNPGLVAWFPGHPAPELVFNGHVDTVPFDREEWSRDPLGEQDGDDIYGRGAADMKGAVAAMLAAARAFTETDTTPSVPIGFVFSSDEETSGSDTLWDGFDVFPSPPAACLIGEMTGTPCRPSVAVADKGSIWLTLAATGEGAHGSRPMLGANAIDRLYDAVDSLRTELRTVKFDLLPAVERILTESVAYYAPIVGEDVAWTMFQHPTVNLGTMCGGEAVNSVPTAATADIDIRLTAGVPTEGVLERIREFVAERQSVEIQSVDWSEGTYEPPAQPLVETVQDVSDAVTGERTFARSATGGGDAKALRNNDISTVEFALGTETAHAVDERTTRPALCQTACIYAQLPSMFNNKSRE